MDKPRQERSSLQISDVAREMGLRPSAIRYYEKVGILPKPQRISGKRRYDGTVLYRLAVIHRAREAGFALEEIRALFFGFEETTPAEARWHRLADRKLEELARLAAQIRSVRTLLKRMKAKCHCRTLEACGKAILENGRSRSKRTPSTVRPRR